MTLRFGSSGIRGKYPEEVNPGTAFELGKKLVRVLGGSLAVGRDPRRSGPVLKASLLAAALEEGARIFDYDMVPTPAVSFETQSESISAGVMITASHNPPEYNGFKVFNGRGEALDGDKSLLVKKTTSAQKNPLRDWGDVETREPNSYRSRLSTIAFHKKWKVVLDPGNGATCYLAPSIYRESFDKVTTINSLPDSTFSARGSEPTPQSMKLLSEVVVETGADVGVGFDGDGDRMFIVDEKGNCPLQDKVLGSYIAFLAGRSKGPYLIPLDASMAIDEVAEKYGARIVRGPVGDAKLLQEMKRWKSKFAGEPSGAWIHGNYSACPDGILSGILYVRSLEELGLTVSEALEGISQYYMMRTSLRLKAGFSPAKARVLGRELRSILGKDSNIDLRYGVRVSSEDSWILVRESGTEPVIRVTGESRDKSRLRRMMRDTVQMVGRISKGRA